MSDNTLHVLIAEDSEDDTLLLLRELRRGGYQPSYSRVDSESGMRQALQDQEWDIVITDHNMPGFDSSATLRLIKENGRDIPVIIVSGSIGEDIAVEAMKSGAHDYIMKGNLNRLIPAVERELREVSTRQARKLAEASLEYMARYDALTGLYNRREFEHFLKDALQEAQSSKREYALLYLDLDQFKVVNDTCGHSAGDELLKQLAVMLGQRIRNQDRLARLGGDEFSVLLEDCDIGRARAVADHLRQVVQDFRFVWEDKVFSIGVSIGVVPISSVSANISELLSMADMACYAAKDQGRNCIQVFEQDNTELVQRRNEMHWATRIDTALEHDRFVLYKQIIAPLQPEHEGLSHYEILLRLRDEDHDVISPGAFIPAAERYQKMHAIDRWVITKVCQALSSQSGFHLGSDPSCLININLSGQSLSDEGLFDFVKDQLHNNDICSESICFEITETAAIGNFNVAVKFINRIKELGCKFALDDFGSGLSSFSYLKALPVDFIKIDGGFVRNIHDDPMDLAIVEAINDIGHKVGIATIAEYVESPEVQETLRRIGVDFAQGYAIDRPSEIPSSIRD